MKIVVNIISICYIGLSIFFFYLSFPGLISMILENDTLYVFRNYPYFIVLRSAALLIGVYGFIQGFATLKRKKLGWKMTVSYPLALISFQLVTFSSFFDQPNSFWIIADSLVAVNLIPIFISLLFALPSIRVQFK